MNSITKPDPELPDEENPEWTQSDITCARPALEVLTKYVGANAADENCATSQGTASKRRTQSQSDLRIDPDVLDAYRQEGKGWQTHINKS